MWGADVWGADVPGCRWPVSRVATMEGATRSMGIRTPIRSAAWVGAGRDTSGGDIRPICRHVEQRTDQWSGHDVFVIRHTQVPSAVGVACGRPVGGQG